jgi:DNA mismatch endonuclease (patch repair protein)
MTSVERSQTMRAVKSRDTGPEMAVRRLAHSMGYRYRLQGAWLPGKPDLMFTKRRAVIFVHGCFWHGHDCKRGARAPKTNAAYWASKIARNRARDAEHIASLKTAGWRALVVWECELKNDLKLKRRIARFLS